MGGWADCALASCHILCTHHRVAYTRFPADFGVFPLSLNTHVPRYYRYNDNITRQHNDANLSYPSKL